MMHHFVRPVITICIAALLVINNQMSAAANPAPLPVPANLREIDALMETTVHAPKPTSLDEIPKWEVKLWGLIFNIYDYCKVQEEQFESRGQRIAQEHAAEITRMQEAANRSQELQNKQGAALKDANGQFAAAKATLQRNRIGQTVALGSAAVAGAWLSLSKARIIRKAKAALRNDPLINWNADLPVQDFAMLPASELTRGAARSFYSDELNLTAAPIEPIISALDERISLLTELIAWGPSRLLGINEPSIQLAKERLACLFILREQLMAFVI